ncbi:MAG: hypothetical protein ABIP20_00840 [Chthoniobacteraceae bacterium]
MFAEIANPNAALSLHLRRGTMHVFLPGRSLIHNGWDGSEGSRHRRRTLLLAGGARGGIIKPFNVQSLLASVDTFTGAATA